MQVEYLLNKANNSSRRVLRFEIFMAEANEKALRAACVQVFESCRFDCGRGIHVRGAAAYGLCWSSRVEASRGERPDEGKEK